MPTFRNALNTPVKLDTSGNILVASGTAGTPIAQESNLANTAIGTDSNGNVLVAFNGAQSFNVNNIVVTSTDGASIGNTTPATAGVPVQMSPRLRFRGTAWDTAASETVDFFIEVLPATAATPTGTFKLGYSLNGGAATYPLTVQSNGNTTFSGDFAANNGVVGASGYYGWLGRTLVRSPANGSITINLNNDSLGSQLKADALPTVASGFGTSPSITAGSTPLAGSVNVGTGGVATSGVINFNGTAFPSAPFVVVTTSLTNAVCRATASTTQLTLTSTTAWTASDVISWICVSSK